MAIIGNKPQIVNAVAGENLVIRDYVFVAHSDAPYTYIDGIVPGRVYKSTKLIRHCSINAELCGFVVAAASAGATVQVRTGGNMSGFTGLAAGATYQPADTAGTIERLENHRAALPNPVATAISTTELCVMPQKWAVRGSSFTQAATISNKREYSTFVVALSSILTSSRYYLGASASSIKGYYAGGIATSNVIDAITFSTDLFADVGDLLTTRQYTSCVSSSLKHYTMCSQAAVSDVIEAVAFATEGNSVDIANQTRAKGGVGVSSSALKYIGSGGWTTAAVTDVDSFIFSTEANATGLTVLSDAVVYAHAFPSFLKHYSLGGYNGSIYVNSIKTIPFSTEVSAVIGGVLSIIKAASGCSSSSVGGVVSGGYTTGNVTISSSDSLLFSTETVTLITSTLSNLGGAGCSSS
jgi:hypothetical protein